MTAPKRDQLTGYGELARELKSSLYFSASSSFTETLSAEFLSSELYWYWVSFNILLLL